MAVVIESQKQVDLDKGIKTNVEIVDGKLQLEIVGEGTIIGETSVVPIMTSNTTPAPFVVSASTQASNLPAWMAFDGTTEGNSRWVSNGNVSSSWLKVKLDKARKVVSYAISAPGTNLQSLFNQMVRSWTIEGSNDDVIWVEIDRVEDQTGWDLRERREYKIANPNIFQYYRLRTHQNNGGNSVLLSEWELFEEIPVLVYKHEGSYETPIIDLSIYSQEINSISAIRNIPEKTNLKIYTSTSNDQISFSDYEEIDYATGNINSPQGRYIKIKVEFFGNTDESENVMNDFSEDERDEFQDDECLEFGDGLRLKTKFDHQLIKNNNWSDLGGVFEYNVEKNNFKSINYLNLSGVVKWNDNDKKDVIIDDDGLTITGLSTYIGVRCNDKKNSGKWYWEYEIVKLAGNVSVGVYTEDYVLGSGHLGVDGNLTYANNGAIYPSGAGGSASWTTGDTIGFALDLDEGNITFFKNNVLQVTVEIDNSKFWFAGLGSGSQSSNGLEVRARFTMSDFEFSPPIGFYPYDNVGKTLFYNNGGYKKYIPSIIEYTNNIIPKMTGFTTPSGKVEASSYWPTWDSPPYCAFDRNPATQWYSQGLPAWISYEFPSPKSVKKYAITGHSNLQTAKDWTFEAWDGSEWVVLDEQINQAFWSDGEEREFPIDNDDYYIKYRLNITQNNGGSYQGTPLARVDELKMFEGKKIGEHVGWNIVSTTFPTLEQFQNEGMDGLSVLDRVPSQFEQEMTDAGVLGEGKLYKTTIDLKKYVDINGLERK